nr:hypothetical protein Itr_chr12CG22480 [Ipomoea trifida]
MLVMEDGNWAVKLLLERNNFFNLQSFINKSGKPPSKLLSERSNVVSCSRSKIVSETLPLNPQFANPKNLTLLRFLRDSMREVEESAIGINCSEKLATTEIKLNHLTRGVVTCNSIPQATIDTTIPRNGFWIGILDTFIRTQRNHGTVI